MSENQAGSWHRDQMRHHLAAHTPIQMDSTQSTLAAAFHHPTANPVGFQLPPTFPGPNALTPNSLYSVPPTSEFDSDEKKSSIFQSQSDFDVWGAAQNCKLSPSEATIVRTATPSANSTESTPTPSSQRHSVGPEEHHEGGEVATKTASNDHDMEQQALREPKSEVMDDATAEATNLLLSLAQHHQDMQPMDTDSASSSQQAVLPTIPQFGQSPTSIAESIASVVNSVATADFEINIPAPVAALRNNATTPTTPNKNSRGFFRPPGLAPSEATATTMADNTKAFICQICSFSCPSRFHYNSHMNTHSDHKCSMCDYTSRTEGRLKKHMREFHTREEQIAAGLDISMMLPQTQSQTPNGNSMNGIPGGQLDVSTGSHGSGGDLSSTMASIMEVANRAIANESSASISDDQATASALESIRAFTENSQNGLANLFHLPPSNPSGNGKPEEAGPSSALTPSTPAAPPRRSGGTKPKKYSCKQCGIISYSKEESWRHNRTHIPVEKQLTCQQCDFVTEYKHHLEYHIRNHYGSKPFKCVKCNYTCVNKSMLNSHMKSHSNNYQFQCMDCNYQSKYCHSLKMHLRKYGHRRKPGTNLDIDDHEEAILNDPSLEDPGSVASAYSDAGNPSTSGLALPTVSVSTAQAGQNGLQQNPESAVTPNQMTNVFSNNLAGQNQMNYVNMLRTLSDLNALNQSSADSLMQQQVNGLVSLGQQQPQQQSQPSSINAIMQYLGQLGQQSPVINGAPPAPPAQQQGLGSALGGFNAADFIQQMQLAQQQQRTFSQPMQTGDVKMEVDVTSAMTPGASSIDGSASSGERSSTSPMESKDGSSVGSTVSSSSKKRKSTKSSKSLEAISQRLASKNSPEQYGEMAMPQPIPASAFKQPFFDRNPSATATVTVGSSAAGSSLPGLSYANNCEHCEIGFGNNALYSIHKGYHNFENPLKCNGCGKTFDSALNFNLHLWHERHV